MEPQLKQHLLLTEAWLAMEEADVQKASDRLGAASSAFREIHVVGEHTPQLLARFSRLRWPESGRVELETWRSVLGERSRRTKD